VRISRLVEQAGEVLEVPRDLLLGRYPAFVTGGPLPKGNVPVFVFHSVEPGGFGRKLRYLADNGYVSLSVEEYYRFWRAVRPGRAPTFDDGGQPRAWASPPVVTPARVVFLARPMPSRLGLLVFTPPTSRQAARAPRRC
jgi:hypothetical protein